jgi:cytochrome c-type biogenesis protein CcmH/NrfG
MAKQQRLSRKEVLNQPGPSDYFMMRIGRIVDWIKANRRSMLYGVLGVMVIVLCIVVWTRWQGHRRQQAAVLLHQALKPIDASDTKQAANSDQVIAQLQVITEKYGRTPAGARAYWHLGHLYFAQGEMSKALEAYEVARRRLPNRQSLSSTLAMLNVGYAQEASDACGEAITSYESVQQAPIHWLRGEAYLGIGRCHEKAGASDQAIEVYERALADVHVTGIAQQTISEHLARLQPSEPEVPAAAPAADHKTDNTPDAAETKAAEPRIQDGKQTSETSKPQ